MVGLRDHATGATLVAAHRWHFSRVAWFALCSFLSQEACLLLWVL